MDLNLAIVRADTDRGTAPLSLFPIDVKPAGFSGTLYTFNMSVYGLIKRVNKKNGDGARGVIAGFNY